MSGASRSMKPHSDVYVLDTRRIDWSSDEFRTAFLDDPCWSPTPTVWQIAKRVAVSFEPPPAEDEYQRFAAAKRNDVPMLISFLGIGIARSISGYTHKDDVDPSLSPADQQTYSH